MTSVTSGRAPRATPRSAGTGPWVERAAHLGLAARGVVYAVIAYLALAMAFGERQQEANKRGALAEIAEKPFGRIGLVVLAVGLIGYVVWRASEAIWPPAEQGDAKRNAKRGISAAKALIYVSLFLTTVAVLRGSGGSEEQQQQSFTAKVLGWPAGQLLVGAAGLALIGIGGYLAYRAVAKKWEDHLDTGSMSPGLRTATTFLEVVGGTARGIVAGLAGALLIKAAIDHDATQAHGVDGTLRTVADQPFGRILLVLTALGLLAFAGASFVESRYRRV